MKKRAIIAGVSLLSLISSCNVASASSSLLEAKTRVLLPENTLAVTKTSKWSGHYLGITAAGLRLRYGFQQDASKAGKPLTDTSLNAAAGIFAGYNIIGKNENFLSGIEFSFDAANSKQLTVTSDKLTHKYGAGARFKVGYATGDFLAYGALGLAYTGVAVQIAEDVERSRNLFGWQAAIGVDYRLVNNIFARLEYQFNSTWAGYDDVAKSRNAADKSATTGISFDRQEIRVGVGFNY